MTPKPKPKKNPANPERRAGHRPGVNGSNNRPAKGWGGAGGGNAGRHPSGRAGSGGPGSLPGESPTND